MVVLPPAGGVLLGFGRPPGVSFRRVLTRYFGAVGGMGVKSRVLSDLGFPRAPPHLSPRWCPKALSVFVRYDLTEITCVCAPGALDGAETMTENHNLIYGDMETAVRDALAKAEWFTPADVAAKNMLISLASQYDCLEEDFEDGRITRPEQVKAAYTLNVHIIQLMKQLGLTPESRQGVPEQKVQPAETDSERRMRERKERRARLAERKAGAAGA